MPSIYDICFHPATGYIETAKGSLEVRNRTWISVESFYSAPTSKEDIDCYFAPAVRHKPRQTGKGNVKGSWVCWVDVDKSKLPDCILPPTATIRSGHGWHLYWRLASFCSDKEELERVNRALAKGLGADSAHNCDRFLRQPDTYNGKEDPPLLCSVTEIVPSREYHLADLERAWDATPKIQRKIITGDRRGFASRSERDFAIIRELVTIGLSDAAIKRVFEEHECGDKYRDPDTQSDIYLETSIANARETAQGVSEGDGAGAGVQRRRRTTGIQFVERDNCYYILDSRGERQVSTFTFTPTMLLEGKDQDFIVGEVRAESTEYVWEDVTWPRAAFANLYALNKELVKASWIWLGRDSDIRHLLHHIVKLLTELGIPRAIAVQTLGFHRIKGDDRSFAVAKNCALASDGSVWFTIQEAPLVYVETDRETPEFVLEESEFDEEGAAELHRLLTQINEPSVIWPVLGWFMASPYKVRLEGIDYRFPILNVTGTRGAGKTTLLLEVMQPLLGVCNARGYDAGTTRFVSLALLGSTNAVAVNFAEFRASMTTDFLRFVLLSYDSGKDARGRPDQTTVTYPLSTPFTLDGEDKVSDPAALERVVVVTMTPKTIEEEGPAWCALQELLETTRLPSFAMPYWQHMLTTDIVELMQQAEYDIFEAFPETLPNRIRRNLTVVWFGVRSYMEFMEGLGVEIDDVDATVLTDCLGAVYSTTLGRAATAADEFAEFIVNAAAQKTKTFPWAYEAGILWFQHTPAFEYFLSRRASQRLSTLTREALKLQLRELIDDYTVPPEVRELKGRKVMAYGIDLTRAHKAGLDLPESFKQGQFIVEF